VATAAAGGASGKKASSILNPTDELSSHADEHPALGRGNRTTKSEKTSRRGIKKKETEQDQLRPIRSNPLSGGVKRKRAKSKCPTSEGEGRGNRPLGLPETFAKITILTPLESDPGGGGKGEGVRKEKNRPAARSMHVKTTG